MNVRIKNFGRLVDVDQEISPGLNVVTGHNGKGKSTFLEALFYAWSGEAFGNVTLDTYINWGEGVTSAIVDIDSPEYLLHRRISATGSQRLTLPGVDDPIINKKLVNQWLFEKYHLSHTDVLRNVYFGKQNEMAEMITTTRQKRLEMLSSIFGLSNIETCRELIYKKAVSMAVPMVSPDRKKQFEDVVGLPGQTGHSRCSGYCGIHARRS